MCARVCMYVCVCDSAPDVVLSLSGDSSYRVNNVTQADGAFTFRELFTGT